MKLGFIGTGNMAGAIIGGIIKNGLIPPEEIIGSDISAPGREHMQNIYGIHVTPDNRKVAERAEVIFLCVKPQYYSTVIAEIKNVISNKQLLISIAPGKTLGWLEEHFGKPVKLVRTMPNTPAMVSRGMTAVCPNDCVSKEELEYVVSILKTIGETEVIPENLIDAVVAVSGSSPAYVFIMIEAMADAAVAAGMPRPQACEFAAQAVFGAAKLMLESGKHPGELKDMVCSPGGTTIQGVRVLEERGMRGAVMDALGAAVEQSRKL